MTTRKPRRPRPQKAVIDRVEDGTWAVLLVGRDELEKIVHVDHLPKGARAGSWLKVRLEDDGVSDIAVDEAETRAAQKRVGSKLDQLRQRGAHFKPISAADADAPQNHLRPLPHPETDAQSESRDDKGADVSPDIEQGETPSKLLGGPTVADDEAGSDDREEPSGASE